MSTNRLKHVSDKISQGPSSLRPLKYGLGPLKFSDMWLLKFWIFHVQNQTVILESSAGNCNKNTY